MRKFWTIPLVAAVFFLLISPTMVLAQEGQPPATSSELSLYTTYPSQVVGIGESVTFSLKLSAKSLSQIVQLKMSQIPDGWTATFRGGGQVVQSVFVQPDNEASVDLKLEPPADIAAGTYQFVARAEGANTAAELPLELTIKEKLPPSLSLTADLPTLKGKPGSTFQYSVTLKNDGDEDLSVNLVDDSPSGFLVAFKLSGQEVTSVPLAANESKRLSVEVQPVSETAAGSYPIDLRAQGGDTEAALTLTAEVTGQADLSITTPDGRLSGQANVGRSTALKIVVQNNGSSPAQGVQLSSTELNGWKVDFQPAQIAEIPAGQQVEVTVNVRPSDQAVAGDYMLTLRANTADGTSKSVDFRVTVLTSTLWGIVGVALIAVAVGVVALAVFRYGRR